MIETAYCIRCSSKSTDSTVKCTVAPTEHNCNSLVYQPCAFINAFWYYAIDKCSTQGRAVARTTVHCTLQFPFPLPLALAPFVIKVHKLFVSTFRLQNIVITASDGDMKQQFPKRYRKKNSMHVAIESFVCVSIVQLHHNSKTVRYVITAYI